MTMRNAIYEYILDHDNRWSFIISYITLAVGLALVLNLFWLAVVVVIHGVFEWIAKGTETESRIELFMKVLWEVKLDIGLIFFGLALGLYMEMVLGVLGLGTATRAAATGGRFVILQKVLRGTLLSIDDAAQVARMVAAKKRNGAGTDGELDILTGPEVEGSLVNKRILPKPSHPLGPWRGPYSWGDIFSVLFGLFWLLMIFAAPYLLEAHTLTTVFDSIRMELDPMPWRE